MYTELIAIINQIKIESARYVVHERTNKKVHRNTLTDGNLLLCSFIELLAPDAFIKERSSKSLEMKKESRNGSARWRTVRFRGTRKLIHTTLDPMSNWSGKTATLVGPR